jgi:hypothetical protein
MNAEETAKYASEADHFSQKASENSVAGKSFILSFNKILVVAYPKIIIFQNGVEKQL